MAPRLQEGIYHSPGVRPPPAFGILFLQAPPDMDARGVGELLAGLWDLYQGLKNGVIPDLPGQSVPHGNLSSMFCYGIKAFELPGSRRTAPSDLQQFGRFRSPLTAGGGSLLLGSGQIYADDLRKNPASETVAVQFIADTPFTVSRAIVETWKFLQNQATTPASGVLATAGFYQGFQRDDGRSWLDFHDGISNLPSDRRDEVITIRESSAGEDQWTVGGTYMVYIRSAVDLSVWRRISTAEQEIQVGRSKLSGCPLISQPAGASPAMGCPVLGTVGVHEQGNEQFFEPQDVPRPSELGMSHVQRVNHHRQDLDARDSLRIYRQGYEFLEPTEVSPGFRAGLNFVSFQDSPERLFRILTQEGWLGRTNFGGDPNASLPGMERLLTTRAAGVFLVPPVVSTEVFPGSSIFMPRPRKQTPRAGMDTAVRTATSRKKSSGKRGK